MAEVAVATRLSELLGSRSEAVSRDNGRSGDDERRLLLVQQRESFRWAYKLNCGVPRRSDMWNWTLDSYKPKNESQKSALRAGTEFVSNWHKNRLGLVFWGEDLGTGKSHLAWAVGMALLNRPQWPVEVRYWRINDFFRQARNGFTASGEGEPDVFFTARDAAVCIFDDIDKMHVGSTGWSLSEWWDIIDYRISIPRPLILTTNWGPDDEDMLAKFDESTISRLVGACEWIRLEGEDYRRTPEYRRRFQKGATNYQIRTDR